MLSPIVTRYVDAAIEVLRRFDLMRVPGKLPKAMLDASIRPMDDSIGWKPIPSTVTDADLDALEREIGLVFPPLYRDFLQYRHFVELTGPAVRFEEHMCHNWQETLRKAYFQSWPRERLLDVGLLPFGSEGMMDAGPVCFDTRGRMPDGDCPVVFLDHEWARTDKEIRLMFSSSRKMFECLTFVAGTDLGFLHRHGADDQALLTLKQELLSQFLSIDPDGAGGPAREYWTCWGITPGG